MKEFTPVFTERATNILAPEFRETMREISRILKQFYNAHSCAVLPGCGSVAMEAVARQFANNKKCLIICNGFFGNRWRLTLQQGKITDQAIILKAEKKREQYHPPELKTVLAIIEKEKPDLIFLTHVETSTGIILPDEYIKTITAAARDINALVVIDAIASGMVWLDLEKVGVDVLITAPQKGLSAQAGCGIVLFNEKTTADINNTISTSLVLDLRKWLEVMKNFEGQGFSYHATLPSDGLIVLKSALQEISQYGKEKCFLTQHDLGKSVRQILEAKGLVSVAADCFKAPSVVVYYADEPSAIVEQFKKNDLRIGGPLPFMLEDEQLPKTFRIGLLGIEKIKNKDATVSVLKNVIEKTFIQNTFPAHSSLS